MMLTGMARRKRLRANRIGWSHQGLNHDEVDAIREREEVQLLFSRIAMPKLMQSPGDAHEFERCSGDHGNRMMVDEERELRLTHTHAQLRLRLQTGVKNRWSNFR
jgi:hypothetical protein